MTRRSWICGSAWALYGAKMSGVRTGCQITDAQDFDALIAVLPTVKQLGIDGFETDFPVVRSQFSRGNDPYERIKKFGLRMSAIAVRLKSYDPQIALPSQRLLEEVANGAKALGAERIIVNGDSTVHPLALRAKADALSRAAKYCKGVGVGCAYRPQEFDFQNGAAQINGLLSIADPNVHFVISAAAPNLPEFFTKNWRRIDEIYLSAAQSESDWEPLAKAIRSSQWRGWLILETPSAPAREAMHRAFGV